MSNKSSTSYEIDYNDERFTKVESDKQAALSDMEKTYDGMIDESDKHFQSQIDASKQWAEKQTELQEQQTEFAIEKIEQQKEQAEKEYKKEQSGAWVDYQKQSGDYGVNAEQMAAAGLDNSGYSESSRVSIYNTYQNRVATAKASITLAKQNYDNMMKEAHLENNSAKAEIALSAYEKELEIAMQGFQYKNQLLLDKANKKTELDSMYYSRRQDIVNQINQENALQEQIRQYKEKMAEDKRQFDKSFAEQQRQFNTSLAEEKRQFNASLKTSGYSIDENGNITSTGPVDGASSKSASYDSILKTASGKSDTAMENYIDQQIKSGKITEEEGDLIYAEARGSFGAREWECIDDGGLNWGSSFDGNAKFKDERGNTYTADQIYSALKEEGWSAERAERYLVQLGKDTGATWKFTKSKYD